MPRGLNLENRKRILSAVGLFVVMATQSVWPQSAAPSLINFQGFLTNAAGEPEADGIYRLDMRIWSDASATNSEALIWGAGYDTPVADGKFNIILGAPGAFSLTGAPSNPGKASVADAFEASERYLGITIVRRPGESNSNTTTVELLPRQKMLSSPFAIQAQKSAHADTADKATEVVVPMPAVSAGVEFLKVSQATAEPPGLRIENFRPSGRRPVMLQLTGSNATSEDTGYLKSSNNGFTIAFLKNDGILIDKVSGLALANSQGAVTVLFPASAFSAFDLQPSNEETNYYVQVTDLAGYSVFGTIIREVKLVAIEL